ncbi:MAG: YjzC family protein [Bacteroidetes bacterium]|nr:YjzC family protein [Bacteroidota bacterium]
MFTKSSFRPGNIAPYSGQYKIIGPRGNLTGEKNKTLVRGEPFPSTPKRGQRYKYIGHREDNNDRP